MLVALLRMCIPPFAHAFPPNNHLAVHGGPICYLTAPTETGPPAHFEDSPCAVRRRRKSLHLVLPILLSRQVVSLEMFPIFRKQFLLTYCIYIIINSMRITCREFAARASFSDMIDE
jgi:hypothetical protein